MLCRAAAVCLLLALPVTTTRVASADIGVPEERAAWQLLAGPVDPPSMQGHVAVRDPRRHRMVVIDGQDAGSLWELSLPATGSPRWTRRAIGGLERPSPRTLFAAVLDSTRDRVVVLGGRQGIYPLADVWSLSLGDAPEWSRIEPQGQAPSARDQVAAILDPLRDRVLISGGVYGADYVGMVVYSETWALNLAGTPRWELLAPQGEGPGRRKGACAVYDPWGDRLIVFGGWVPYTLPPPYFSESFRTANDTWALSLSGTLQWAKLDATNPPPARQESVALLDADGRRMIVTGGNTSQWQHPVPDTWTLPLAPGAPPVWSELPTSGDHRAVDRHAAVHSPERASILQYGGENDESGTRELDLASRTWTAIESDAPPHHPSRRVLPSLIPDPSGGSLLLFGGGWGCQHDLWSFPFEGVPDWTPLPTTGTAPTCTAPNFVYDPKRHRLLAFKPDSDPPGHGFMDQVWELPLDEPRTWTRLDVTETQPQARVRFGLAYDARRDRVLVFGGATYRSGADNFGADHDDLWAFSLADRTWTQLHPVNTPGARRSPWIGYDAKRDRLLLVGGSTAGFLDSYPVYDDWELPLASDSLRWTPFGPDVPSAVPPVFDPLRRRLVLWSGASLAWALAVDDPSSWSPIVLAGDLPTPRDYGGTAYDAANDRMLVFGGGTGLGRADLQALRFSDPVDVLVDPRHPGPHRDSCRGSTLELAILGSDSFDVDSVLTSTATLDGARAIAGREPRGRRESHIDVDRDGHDDLLLRFAVEAHGEEARDSLLLLARTPHFAVRGWADLRPDARHPRGRHPGRHDGFQDPGVVPGGLRITPNPAGASASIRFALPTQGPATLELIDLAGRRVWTREVGAYGAGEHFVPLAQSSRLPKGIYFVRLTQGVSRSIARVVVLQ